MPGFLPDASASQWFDLTWRTARFWSKRKMPVKPIHDFWSGCIELLLSLYVFEGKIPDRPILQSAPYAFNTPPDLRRMGCNEWLFPTCPQSCRIESCPASFLQAVRPSSGYRDSLYLRRTAPLYRCITQGDTVFRECLTKRFGITLKAFVLAHVKSCKIACCIINETVQGVAHARFNPVE